MSYEAREPEIPIVGAVPRPPPSIPPYQGVPQLFIEVGSVDHLLYRIGHQWYNATDLSPNQVPLNTIQLRYLTDIDFRNLRSHPVYLGLQDDWNVLHTYGDRLLTYEGDNIEEILTPDTVETVVPLLVSIQTLPPFNDVWFERLVDLSNNDLSLEDLDLSPLSPQRDEMSPSPLRAGLGINRSTNEPVYVVGNYVYALNAPTTPTIISPAMVEFVTDFSQLQSAPVLVRTTEGWVMYAERDNQIVPIASSHLGARLPGNIVSVIDTGSLYEVGRLGESVPRIPISRIPHFIEQLRAFIGRPLSDVPFPPPRSPDPSPPPLMPTPPGSPPGAPLRPGPRSRIPEFEQRWARPDIPRFQFGPDGRRVAISIGGTSSIAASAALAALSARRPESPQETPAPPPMLQESYEALLRQLYGLPVTTPEALVVNQLRTPFVTFERAVELLQSGRVVRFDIDPLVQVWAGLPSQPNRIVTLILQDGTTVLVKARFDPTTNQIFPPA